MYEYSFDFKDFSTNFIPLIVGIGFLCISLLFVWNKKTNPKDSNSLFFRVIGFVVGPLGIGMAVLSMWGMIAEHFVLVDRIASEDVYVVEGYVENFHPMPREGHDHESFEINGVYFEYSDYKVMNGYNNSASHGGVVTKNGQYLKIKYVTEETTDENEQNVILYIAEIEPPA